MKKRLGRAAGRLLAVGNAVGAGVGVWEYVWRGVRTGVLGGGGLPPLRATSLLPFSWTRHRSTQPLGWGFYPMPLYIGTRPLLEDPSGGGGRCLGPWPAPADPPPPHIRKMFLRRKVKIIKGPQI